MKVYLKTTLTSEAEYIFIIAQYLELANLIDRIIIVEPAFTHTGFQREMIGVGRLLQMFPQIACKLDYIPIPLVDSVILNAKTESECHYNERLTRGLFVNYISLNLDDIVISTDADEVLYAQSVNESIERVSSKIVSWRAETLTLYQFVYKDFLMAPDYKFKAASIIGAGRYFLSGKPQQWRYAGAVNESFSGCHFSWCMPIENLEIKINTFAHAKSYIKNNEDPKEKILNDIDNLVYSFRLPNLPLIKLEEPELLWPRGYLKAKEVVGA